MPLSTALGHQFFLVLPEAYLLTGKRKRLWIKFVNEIKSGQRPVRKAGQGVWPAARKLFSDLMLFTYYLFFIGVHYLALLGLGYFFI